MVVAGSAVASYSIAQEHEQSERYRRMEEKFLSFSSDKSQGLSINEFVIALAPDYLMEEAKAKYSGLKPGEEGRKKPKKKKQKKKKEKKRRKTSFFVCIGQFSPILRDAGDLNGNKKIDYAEFSFFQTLLGVPEREIEICFRLFDVDDSGSLDEQEFLQVIDVVTKGHAKIQKLELPSLFGRKKKVTLPEFRAWNAKVKKEVAKIEFDLLDEDNDGKITATQFGRTLTAYGQEEVFAKVRADLADNNERLTFEDFWKWQLAMENVGMIDDAIRLFMVGQAEGVTRPQFKRAVAVVSKQDALPDIVFDTVFTVFNANGKLSRPKFTKQMLNRVHRGNAEDTSEAISTPACFVKCFNSEIINREASNRT
jgi:Ca2+-binding EF-hand superfamily protein